eukprot:2513000-Rhodomonas_salina.1
MHTHTRTHRHTHTDDRDPPPTPTSQHTRVRKQLPCASKQFRSRVTARADAGSSSTAPSSMLARCGDLHALLIVRPDSISCGGKQQKGWFRVFWLV